MASCVGILNSAWEGWGQNTLSYCRLYTVGITALGSTRLAISLIVEGHKLEGKERLSNKPDRWHSYFYLALFFLGQSVYDQMIYSSSFRGQNTTITWFLCCVYIKYNLNGILYWYKPRTEYQNESKLQTVLTKSPFSFFVLFCFVLNCDACVTRVTKRNGTTSFFCLLGHCNVFF